jgi:hypothetical protein
MPEAGAATHGKIHWSSAWLWPLRESNNSRLVLSLKLTQHLFEFNTSLVETKLIPLLYSKTSNKVCAPVSETK